LPATSTLPGTGTLPNGRLRASDREPRQPVTGAALDPKMLNSRLYIDVKFTTRSGDAIDAASIDGDEITLRGTGKLDGALKAGAPLLLHGTTYRYFFVDTNPSNDRRLRRRRARGHLQPRTASRPGPARRRSGT
jgi:hypothetical protein